MQTGSQGCLSLRIWNKQLMRRPSGQRPESSCTVLFELQQGTVSHKFPGRDEGIRKKLEETGDYVYRTAAGIKRRSTGDANPREIRAPAPGKVQTLSLHYIDYRRTFYRPRIYVRYGHVEAECKEEYHRLHVLNLHRHNVF